MVTRNKLVEKKIRGQVIRIPDTKTVVINLGSDDCITLSSVFSILGEPETIIDPFTEKELGKVILSKGRVKASLVQSKFTIATTEWNEWLGGWAASLGPPSESEVIVHEGDLNVDPIDIQPWKAKSEQPVKVGDTVEVTVKVPPEEKPEEDF